MLLWWRSSRTRPTSSTLLERFSKKQIWVNSAIKISEHVDGPARFSIFAESTKCIRRCRFEDLCNRFSCTQLMLTTFARSSGHFLKSKRLEGFLPSTNTSELPKSPRSLQRLICFPLFHNCKNCKCFSLSKFHMLIIIFVEILDWKYKDTAALCSDWLVMTISG